MPIPRPNKLLVLFSAAGLIASASSLFAPSTVSAAIAFRAPVAQLFPRYEMGPDRPITFVTLDNHRDPTFNQLLGINNKGVIAGYFGSGAAGHPNKGYRLLPPDNQHDYRGENFPGSAQTQVTAIDNIGNTAGFWVDASGNNFGFVRWNNVFTSYKDPHTGTGTVNQLLGINDLGIAVGFYVDGAGVTHAVSLNQATGVFTEIVPPGGKNPTATGINNNGDITGFLTTASGASVGWLDKGGSFSDFTFPRATSTMPFGINLKDQIVGVYTDRAGAMHGFILSNPLTHAIWRKVDDPNGIGTTTVNGINDMRQIVGFYVDSGGNTDGFLGTL
jgi:hypothetical protein